MQLYVHIPVLVALADGLECCCSLKYSAMAGSVCFNCFCSLVTPALDSRQSLRNFSASNRTGGEKGSLPAAVEYTRLDQPVGCADETDWRERLAFRLEGGKQSRCGGYILSMHKGS